MDLSFYTGKKVFVTGHTGFKGTWLSNVLLQAGALVTGYSLKSATNPSLFEQTNTGCRMTSIIGDIRDLASLSKAVRESEPEIVFHLAAQPLVRLSYREPVGTYETNVMGTVHILEAIRHTPSVRSFVNVTTDKVYEIREWHWGYRENDNLDGYDPYSNSKSCSELVTSSYRNSFFSQPDSPSVSTARSGNVIGGGDYSEDRIIPDCVRASRAGKQIVVRNPHSTRPYQHVLDCLSGYLLLAEKQYQDSSLEGSYNFGPDDVSCVTTGALVSVFCEYWKGTSWIAQKIGGPHEAGFLKLDCSKAKSVLHWNPHWDINVAVEKVVEFARLGSDEERNACLEKHIHEYFSF
ncbi:MAG: CDP-glucose 4,6-dehydratase [Opitutales bacterium]|nr:CDP-glucose 4,6-dehydratase [Opitutales bacterium]